MQIKSKVRYTIENFMATTLFSSHEQATRRRLGFLSGLLFIVLLLGGYFLWHRSQLAQPWSADQNPVFVPAQTPAELQAAYRQALATVLQTIQAPSGTAASKVSTVNDFFFTARVPSEWRDAHLQALLQVQKNSQIEKITTILQGLQTKTSSPK